MALQKLRQYRIRYRSTNTLRRNSCIARTHGVSHWNKSTPTGICKTNEAALVSLKVSKHTCIRNSQVPVPTGKTLTVTHISAPDTASTPWHFMVFQMLFDIFCSLSSEPRFVLTTKKVTTLPADSQFPTLANTYPWLTRKRVSALVSACERERCWTVDITDEIKQSALYLASDSLKAGL
jgi:hypothetical protein